MTMFSLVAVVVGAFCLEFSSSAPATACTKQLDVAFLVDQSASIPDDDFEEVKKFCDTTVRYLASSNGSRFGLIEFADTAKAKLWLEDKENTEGPIDAVTQKFKDMKRKFGTGFNTNTHLAFFIARSQMLNSTYGAGTRCDGLRVLILITDGAPSWQMSAYMEAKATAEEGIIVFVVGTGADSNFGAGTGGSRRRLAQYYTGDDITRVFRVEKYEDLDKMSVTISNYICDETNKLDKADLINELDNTSYEENPDRAQS